MKKSLILIFFLSLAFSQSLDRLEEKLIPVDNMNVLSNSIIDDRSLTPSFILDQNKSTFIWTGGLKFGATNHDGNLKMKSGNILLENNKITGEVVINMLSMTNSDMPEGSGNRLVGHLKSADFFNVERFPSAKLKIEKSRIIEKLENGKYKMIIDGLITIKGNTKPISFETNVDLDSKIKTAEGRMTFNRNDFDIQYRSEMHLDNPNTFWNKLQTTRDTAKDKVIRENIEIDFKVSTMPGMLSK